MSTSENKTDFSLTPSPGMWGQSIIFFCKLLPQGKNMFINEISIRSGFFMKF